MLKVKEENAKADYSWMARGATAQEVHNVNIVIVAVVLTYIPPHTAKALSGLFTA